MDDVPPPNDERRGARRTKRISSAVARKSRAARLLEALIVRQLASVVMVADALGVSSQQVEAYRTGLARIPLQVQRRLADLVISSVPELGREAWRLQLQSEAEAAFHAKETATHMVAPPAPFR